MVTKTKAQDKPGGLNLVATAELIEHIKLEDLHPNPYQPESRIEVGEDTAKEFGLSILEHGLLQTPVGRMRPDGSYELGDGWLRRSGFKWLVANGHPEFVEWMMGFPIGWLD